MRKDGFTAVELLITLFIGSVFLLAGYQLWAYSVKSAYDTDRMTKASNVAYDYLRRYTPASGACSAATPVNGTAITVTGLSNVTVTVQVTCPYTALPNVSKVVSTVQYDNPAKAVSHAILSQ